MNNIMNNMYEFYTILIEIVKVFLVHLTKYVLKHLLNIAVSWRKNWVYQKVRVWQIRE